MELAARLHTLGARGVLITGGHLAEPVDFLSIQQAGGGRLVHHIPGEHLDSPSTHGTGCALATALACLLAKGTNPMAAVAEAKEYVREAIRQADPLGRGIGPIQHLYGRQRPLGESRLAEPHPTDGVRSTALNTQTKSFWLLFTILGMGALWLPLGWGIFETFVALGVSWWVIYRTDLF